MAKPYSLYLYQDVGDGGKNASQFIDELKAAKDNPVDLHINSYGGVVTDGYAIYNALRNHAPGVTVHIDGIAASIASYIAMAGSAVFMAENALIMIHLPGGGSGRTAEEKRKDADILDLMTNSLVDAYASRTGIPDSEIRKMLDEETWMDAKQALAFGFVDGITEPLEMAAKFDANALKNFKNVPDAVKERISKESMKAGNPEEPTNEIPTPENPIPGVPREDSLAADLKPSIFARVKAMLGTNQDFLAQIESYKAQLDEKDAEIEKLSNLVTVSSAAADAAMKDADQLRAEAKDLEEAIAKRESEAKTASDRAIDIVAAAGFSPEKLPAVQPADSVKSAEQLLAEYEPLPAAQKTQFLRDNAEAIAKANAELKKGKK